MRRHSVKCSTCGDELPDGTADCLRCNWGGWTNTPHDNTVNPPDPTIDMHRGIQASMDPSCPKCGSPMYWRDAAGLTGLHPEGAWECSNQRCWNMLTPGNLAPDIIPEDPDTGHSDLTLPDHWSMVHEADYQGWTNWDTWNTKLMMDNDYDLYQQQEKMLEQGWTPEQIRDWALHHVVGPHNKQAIEDAREWNEIPEHDRLDHHFEDLKDKSPEAAELVNNLGFGPDVSDDEPTLIDPELVNWHEIHQNLNDEHNENLKFEQEQQRYKEMDWPWANTGHSDEVNYMKDAWMRHHNADPNVGHYENTTFVPESQMAEMAPFVTPNSHLSGPEEKAGIPLEQGDWWQKNVTPHGGWHAPTQDLAWEALNAIQSGRATDWQHKTMTNALLNAGHDGSAIARIMRQKRQWDGNQWHQLEQPAPAPPDPSLDQPGELTFPSDWQAPGGPGTFSRVIPQDRWWFAPQESPEGS